MSVSSLWARVQGRYQRSLSRRLFRRPLGMRNEVPLISFTFDDFPRSALQVGGEILKGFGVAGTYYTSLGLMGQQAPTGAIFVEEDLRAAAAQGHELGCHTYHHCHSWDTPPRRFEESILRNQEALKKFMPQAVFETFSYPITCPRPANKRRTGGHFACSRGGGQTCNVTTADLNHLSAYFLEKDAGNSGPAKRMIDWNQRHRGWLIFATHDVCDAPTPYGCQPAFFEEVVAYAIASGSKILPVIKALAVAQGDSKDRHFEKE
jgi:peptidoglycan/xylan/chitin deacetylase (PgdA/CDA1 family)